MRPRAPHRRVVALAAVCVAFLGAGLARADDAQKDLKRGVYAYEHGDYAEAIGALSGVLSPLRLTAEDDIAQARRYLGAAYFFTERKQDAAEEFKKLLMLRPDAALDPFNFPPPLVLFFDEVKAGLKDRLEKWAADAPKSVVKETLKIVDRRVELHPLYVNFIPLGAPQFQNGDRVKGWVLLGTETALIATNVLSYWMARSYADDLGYYPTENARSKAGAWGVIQMTSLGLLGGAVIYGVVDGIYNWKSETIRQVDGR